MNTNSSSLASKKRKREAKVKAPKQDYAREISKMASDTF